MKILPINKKLVKKLKAFGIEKKFYQKIQLFLNNPYHPSLHTELLEPKEYRIYSFRIDRKFRALFIFRDDQNAVEILNITAHYQ